CNQASIVFDVNDAILTPQWCNTIDHTAPASAVTALPATSPQSIDLTWTGSDGGAGIATYTIYVSTDGGAFTALLTDTEDTQTTFQGQIGSSYAFYSVARDLVGNQEDPPASPDAHTKVIATGSASDLAITRLTVPKTVALTAKRPSVTKTITVQVQNRSGHT